jgi:hypothetical protein
VQPIARTNSGDFSSACRFRLPDGRAHTTASTDPLLQVLFGRRRLHHQPRRGFPVPATDRSAVVDYPTPARRDNSWIL